MRDLKNYIWILPFVGVFTCIISLFTPAAFIENRYWDHIIIKWMWGYYHDNRVFSIGGQGLTVESRFYSDPLQLLSSVTFSLIIIVCIGIMGLSAYKHRNDFKNGIIKKKYSLFPALVIIISVIMWMIMMEIAELVIYDLSMWTRYTPNFGVIGMFIGTILIITGFVVIRKYGLRDTNLSPD